MHCIRSRFLTVAFLTGLAMGLTLLLGACDSNDVEEDEEEIGRLGSSSFTVSGAASGSFSGQAVFGTFDASDGDRDGFSLVLFDATDGDTTFVGLVRADTSALPQEQTYDVTGSSDTSSSDDFAAVYVRQSGSAKVIALAESGTLTFTSVSDDELTGSFAFDGNTAEQQPRSVTAEGDFTAVRVDEEDVPTFQF